MAFFMQARLARLPDDCKRANWNPSFNHAYMKTLQERMADLMAATGWSVGKIAAVAGVTSSAVSQWVGHGDGKQSKSIGNIASALKLEKESGFSALWLAQGKGPKLVGPKMPEAPMDEPPEADELLGALRVVAKAIEPTSTYVRDALIPTFTNLVRHPQEVGTIARTIQDLIGSMPGHGAASENIPESGLIAAPLNINRKIRPVKDEQRRRISNKRSR